MTSTIQPPVSLGVFVKTSLFAIAIAIGSLVNLPMHAEELDSELRVLGYQKCMDCHELNTEAWMRSSHAQRSLAMLSSNTRALRYASRLDIEPSELAHNSVCTDCHGTRQRTDEGALQVAHGVSCESCHGAAGASSTSVGWYEHHSGEEPHPAGVDAESKADLQEAGAGDLYSLAVRCYGCHSVSNEEVVQAGHVAGASGFELTTWFSGEVRHNFAPYTVDVEDDEKNTLASNVWLAKHEGVDPAARTYLMYVVGQLADLEVNLRNRAKATREGTFATSAASRSVAAHLRLQQIANQVEADGLHEAIAALESVRPLLFLSPEESQEPIISRAADEVARAARKFVASHDGSKLAAIEPLLPSETRGEAFQP